LEPVELLASHPDQLSGAWPALTRSAFALSPQAFEMVTGPANRLAISTIEASATFRQRDDVVNLQIGYSDRDSADLAGEMVAG
jgi:hypothetical protein